MNKVDKWRVFPRLMLVSFIIITYICISWYLAFPTQHTQVCDPKILIHLVDKEYTDARVKDLACTNGEVIGRPHGYTFLISTIIGTLGLVFNFYVNSGPRRGDPRGES